MTNRFGSRRSLPSRRDDLRVVVDRLGPAPDQRVRPDRPQPAAAAGDPLHVRLAVRRSGQLHEVGEPEAALAPGPQRGRGRVEHEAVDRRGLVARDPEVLAVRAGGREVVVAAAAHEVAGEPQCNPSGDVHAVFLLVLRPHGQGCPACTWQQELVG